MDTYARRHSMHLSPPFQDAMPKRPGTPHICTGVVTPNALDSRESDNGLQIIAQLPGVEREEVNVTIERGGKELVLNVRKRSKDQDELGKEISNFRVFGEFTKRFDVPFDCDTNAVQIDCESSGQISVLVPKAISANKNIRRMSYS